ncbi:flagellar protein FlhE [Herbaspirillum sp. NPDC101397]|uniref:flagellar protein FlhE n=1 Tax=Herbaspirillum sp. NPDC101397 TaxID=3364006 RepID=UPI00383ADCF3
MALLRTALVATLGLALAGTVVAQTRVDRTLSVPATGAPAIVAPHAAVIAPPPQNTLPPPPAPRGPSGSYAADAMGATILAKNADYETTFSISTPVPPGATISNVSWRYGLSEKPVGFEAVLCWNNRQRCWNVTNNASGSTGAFNGKDAAQPFTLHYRVKGGGQLGPPARGEMNQVIVTYQLPG